MSLPSLRTMFFGLCGSFLLTTQASAGWTMNLGYHNPVYSKLGLNFLYWGPQWNFEIGLGWVDAAVHADDDNENETEEEKKDDKVSASIAGDLDIKYRFSSGSISPYIQGGYGIWSSATLGDDSGAHADIGGPFAGGGLLFGKESFHVYVAGNYMIDPKNVQVQGGFGFSL